MAKSCTPGREADRDDEVQRQKEQPERDEWVATGGYAEERQDEQDGGNDRKNNKLLVVSGVDG